MDGDTVKQVLLGIALWLAPLVLMALVCLAVIWRIRRSGSRRRAMAGMAAALGFRFYPNDPTSLIAKEIAQRAAAAGAGGGNQAAQIGHWMGPLLGQLGLSFSADDPGDAIEKFLGPFGVFQNGWGTNVLVGPGGGASIRLFDYEYGADGSRDRHHAQVCVMDLPIVAPRLQVRPEGALDRLAEWAGHEELRFESPAFSRRCHVKCEEPKFAYDVLNLRLIEFLLARPDVPIIEMKDSHMLLYFDGQGDVDRFRRLLETGAEILRRIPDYVLHDRAAPAAGKA